MSKQYKYQQQDSSQTLQQGLAEYYASIPGLIIPEATKDKETAKMLTLHDVTHVIFGCSTEIEDEFLCDTWTIFGSNVSFSKYLEYMQYPESQQIFKEVGYLKIIWIGIKIFPQILKVIWQTRKMSKKWGWTNYKKYLYRPLKDIRQVYNICLV
ncbi:MAG: hypothetical protein ACFBSE_16975 [Prochloraceae cyanobacterium]